MQFFLVCILAEQFTAQCFAVTRRRMHRRGTGRSSEPGIAKLMRKAKLYPVVPVNRGISTSKHMAVVIVIPFATSVGS